MKKLLIVIFILLCFYSFSEVILEDFESMKWVWRKWDANEGKISISNEIFKEKSGSLKFQYDFERIGATCLEWSNINKNWGEAEGIGIWVYGDNSKNNLIFRIFTNGNDYCSSNRIKIKWEGWRYIYIPKKEFMQFGNGVDWKKISFMYIVLEHPSDGERKGEIYLDKLVLANNNEEKEEASSSMIILKDSKITVLFNKSKGGIKINSTNANYTFVEPKEPFWKIILLTSENKIKELIPEEGKLKIFTDEKSKKDVKIVYEYEFPESKSVEVIIEGKLKTKGISAWKIEVKNNSDNIIRYIEFPRFSIKDDNGNLAFPLGKGILIKNPSQNKGLSNMVNYYGFDAGGGYYPCSLQTMQFFTYYSDKGGLYFATHDSKCFMKQFRYEPESGGFLNFVLKVPVENMKTKGNSYSQTWDTIIGIYEGDWYDASLIYRDWAIKQLWCQKGPIYKRKDIPEWFKNNILWLSAWLQPKSAYYLPNYYPELIKERGIENLLSQYTPPSEYVIKFKKYFLDENETMGFQWYAWNIQSPWYMEFPHYGQKFDPNFPELCPHKETPEEVLKMLKENIRTIPYVNTYLWEKCVPSYEKAKLYAVKNEDGSVKIGYSRKDNENKNWENVAMCPFTEWYQEMQAKLLSSLLKEVKFDGLYLDQITAVAPQLCFDSSHGHPVGGGSWWVEGYRKLIEKVRKKVREVNPDAILTSEANTEPFIDLLDGNLAITPTFSNEVPLYKVVYGDYSIVYGRKPSLDMLKNRISFDAMMGLSFINGEQIGWFSAGEVVKTLLKEEFEPQREYMKKIIKGIKFARKFLIEGRYQKPLKIDIEGEYKELEFTTNLATYPYSFTLSSVLSSLYKSYDNELCFVLTNYTDKNCKITFEVVPENYGIKKKKLKIWENGQIKAEKLIENSVKITKEIPPKSIEIYIVY